LAFVRAALLVVPLMLAGTSRAETMDTAAPESASSGPLRDLPAYEPPSARVHWWGFGLDLLSFPRPSYVRRMMRHPADLRRIEPFDLYERAPGELNVIDGRELPLPTAQEEPLDTRPMTLAEARQAALQYQLEIQAELIPPAIAEQQVREARARFHWVLLGEVSQVKDHPLAPEPETDDRTAAIGLSIPLPTGGSAQVVLPVTKHHLDPVPSGVPSPYYSASPSITVTQPLLRGAGLRVNLAPINRSKLLSRQTQARTKLLINNLLANVDRAYWRLWAARREVEVRYEQYQMAQQQLYTAQRLAGAGIVPKMEILRSEVGIAQRVNNLIVATTNARLIERELKRTLNLPDLGLATETAILTASEPELFPLSLETSSLVEHAMQNRMDLLVSQLQLAMDLLDRDVARNQLLPDVSVVFEHSRVALGLDRGDTINASDDSDDWRTAGYIRFSMPIGNTAARARLRQSALRYASSLNSLEQREQLIEQDVYDAVDLLNQSWQQIRASEEEISLARGIYQGELQLFERSIRTSTEVLDAAQFLANAQVRRIQAIAEYEMAKVQLAYVTGTHLGYAQVELEPYDERRAD